MEAHEKWEIKKSENFIENKRMFGKEVKKVRSGERAKQVNVKDEKRKWKDKKGEYWSRREMESEL